MAHRHPGTQESISARTPRRRGCIRWYQGLLVTVDGWLLRATACSIYSLWNPRLYGQDDGYTHSSLATSCAAGRRKTNVRYDVSFGRSPSSTPEACSYEYIQTSPCGNAAHAAISEKSNLKMTRIIHTKSNDFYLSQD